MMTQVENSILDWNSYSTHLSKFPLHKSWISCPKVLCAFSFILLMHKTITKTKKNYECTHVNNACISEIMLQLKKKVHQASKTSKCGVLNFIVLLQRKMNNCLEHAFLYLPNSTTHDHPLSVGKFPSVSIVFDL